MNVNLDSYLFLDYFKCLTLYIFKIVNVLFKEINSCTYATRFIDITCFFIFQVVFEVITSGYQGYLAIDDVKVLGHPCSK